MPSKADFQITVETARALVAGLLADLEKGTPEEKRKVAAGYLREIYDIGYHDAQIDYCPDVYAREASDKRFAEFKS